MTLFQVRVGVDRGGEQCRSGPIASFARLEEAERWAIDLLRRTPVEPGADRYVAITTAAGDTHAVLRPVPRPGAGAQQTQC